MQSSSFWPSLLALCFKQAAVRAGQLHCKPDGLAAHMVLHVGAIAQDCKRVPFPVRACWTLCNSEVSVRGN